MTKRVLIIGGYGNFGRFITKKLARESCITLVIAGRNEAKAKQFSAELDAINPAEGICLDIDEDLPNALAAIRPDIVIHTAGPFQTQGYQVAEACIAQHCHYLDLADSRSFVCNITSLNERAINANVLICSGASSVPALTSAIIDHYLNQFDVLEVIDYGITTAQRTSQGLATTKAVLSYAGKPFFSLRDGQMKAAFGWTDLRWRKFWGLNRRGLANCDIPDLELFPARYPTLKSMRFQAGLELKALHITLVFLAKLVQWKCLQAIHPYAGTMLKWSRFFDVMGSDNSGFFMRMEGRLGLNQKNVELEITAYEGDGPYIPCIPAIILAKKLAQDLISVTGASPCVGYISLPEYLQMFDGLNIEWRDSQSLAEGHDTRCNSVQMLNKK